MGIILPLAVCSHYRVHLAGGGKSGGSQRHNISGDLKKVCLFLAYERWLLEFRGLKSFQLPFDFVVARSRVGTAFPETGFGSERPPGSMPEPAITGKTFV